MKAPIHIMGCPHSGSSLMQAILGSHSKIHMIKGESRLFYQNENGYRSTMREFELLALKHEKNRWADKSPEHIQLLGAIMEHNNPKVIIMIRDARDVVASLKERSDYTVESAIGRWIADNAVALSFENHSQVILVKYENVVTDFENTVKDVFGFIGEDYEPKVKEFHKLQDKAKKPRKVSNRKSILELRRWQVSQPLYDGRGKRKNLTLREINLVNVTCEAIMTRLGYSMKEEL